MAADMSGFAGPGGAEAWMAASGGDRAAFNREMKAWQGSQAPAAAPAPNQATPGVPGAGNGSDQAVAEANAAYAAGQRGSDPNAIFGQGGEQAYRDWYNQQQGGNRPEDMERFSGATLAGWDQYMIKSGPNAGKYRSMRGAPGVFDKPTECPPGQGPQGGSETDPCGSAGYSTPGPGQGGGGQGPSTPQGGAPAPKPALTPQQELQQKLKEMYQNREGQFVGQANTGQELSGGGIFWGQQEAPGTPAANPTIAAISSGSGATPLSQGVTPAPQVQATSSFAQSVGQSQPAQQSIPMPATAKSASAAAPTQAQSMGVAAPTGQTALSDAVKKQYSNPREQQQWWKAM